MNREGDYRGLCDLERENKMKNTECLAHRWTVRCAQGHEPTLPPRSADAARRIAAIPDEPMGSWSVFAHNVHEPVVLQADRQVLRQVGKAAILGESWQEGST